jgi:hypothetical protein
MKTSQRGYSLVEVAVVLLALGLVLIGITLYWQQTSSLRVKASQSSLQQQAKDAALGFMYARYRLACPARDAGGVEDCGTAPALNAVGYVPWRTLGMSDPSAGFLKYGVYRVPNSTSAHLDQDLAVSRDRMNPLRTRTPNPRPSNNRAPNSNTPPAPSPAENLLGHTYSGNWALPLNTNCVASNPMPCSASASSSDSNMIDICLALNNVAAQSAPPASALAVNYAGARRSAALVIAAAGMLDADADGNAFDGLNALASNTAPTFEASSREMSASYDDQVTAVSALELFSMYSCAAGLASASHGHMNVSTSAFMMERAYYDLRDQLDVKVRLADADIAATTATGLAAGAQVTAAISEGLSASGDAVQSLGGRSFQIGLAVAAGVAAGIAVGAAVATIVITAQGKIDADKAWNDFATVTTQMTDLAISIANNALLADAVGF